MSGRRGSVRQEKNGTWFFVVDVVGGRGQRSQTRRRGFRTCREVQAALKRDTELAGPADVRTPSRLTLGSYLTETWLPPSRARSGLRRSTARAALCGGMSSIV